MRLAMKFATLRPDPFGIEGIRDRQKWAAMVNAVTGSGLVKEEHIRDFRKLCGWDHEIDVAVQEPRKEPIGGVEGDGQV